MRLLFATNDSRSVHLENALRARVREYATVKYDPIPLATSCIARLITIFPNRKIWWNRYQWHPCVQRARRNVLAGAVREGRFAFDKLIMWGSWFDPFIGTIHHDHPFYLYIDQSCNKVADNFDIQSHGLKGARTRFNRSQRATYERCTTIFCMSEWARRQTLQSHDIDPGKLLTVGWGPIGVNLASEEITFAEQEKMVLFVGHQFYRKGVDFLRDALPVVVKEVPETIFVIVGANSDHLKVGPHPNLKLLGSVRDPERMADLYRRAQVFVLPHRFDRSPHVLVEAMSAGKPIVASNQGGAPEVIIHGKTGFLIDVGDVKSLAGHLIALLRNKELCGELGKRGKSLMISGFTWDIVAEKMLKRMSGEEKAPQGTKQQEAEGA